MDDCNYADPEPLYNVHYQDHFFTSRGLRLHGILMVNDTFAPEDVGKVRLCVCDTCVFHVVLWYILGVSAHVCFPVLCLTLVPRVHRVLPQPYVNIFHSHGTARNLAVNYRLLRYAFMLKQGGVRIFTYDYPGVRALNLRFGG